MLTKNDPVVLTRSEPARIHDFAVKARCVWRDQIGNVDSALLGSERGTIDVNGVALVA